ncbi:cytosolic carboxypeptidase 2-like [Oncorhynchus clarkii lewisi]|uniref:cytosolic carboxypeptidase 2-like n=1 Tax=Oncorhynchus clarkii lewisi TaxID=490388 RepID=UPI0039B87966
MEKGNVVYFIDSATKTSYFTCSHVGGSWGLIKSSTSCATHQDQSFESRFESGNLHQFKLVSITTSSPCTLICTPPSTRSGEYFRVRNMKASSLYCTGMRSMLYSEIAAWEKGGLAPDCLKHQVLPQPAS